MPTLTPPLPPFTLTTGSPNSSSAIYELTEDHVVFFGNDNANNNHLPSTASSSNSFTPNHHHLHYNNNHKGFRFGSFDACANELQNPSSLALHSRQPPRKLLVARCLPPSLTLSPSISLSISLMATLFAEPSPSPSYHRRAPSPSRNRESYDAFLALSLKRTEAMALVSPSPV
ncbi:hypothetical protein PIB30_010901 [Stylosanthes scabra]|uniref:Uncharacterized protein n=1 Tax=Stylosanthes scabra TaxID=79078 RepID=A0ABU6S638_9FABA|nr:hypothetical protein [Stylosanthes scabra]